MKNAFLLSIVLLGATISNAQNRAIAGDWLGSLSIGVKLRLVLHVQSTAPGVYTGTLDSPDQGVKDIPASSVTVKGDSLHVGVDVIKGGFDGAFVDDTTVTGTWSQGPGKAAMTMVKTREAFKVNRPQTPKAPFSYKSEDVEYDNADKSVHFGGTITYPSTGSSFPAAILITGSGQQDRDETLFEHKPFAVIADYLTKQGFAVLRVDDRGIGKTKGEISTATSADFAKDVEAGIAYLKSKPEVDTTRMGLIGHSEGGLIAEIVASRRKDINFVVLLAGPGVKGSELLSEQSGAVLESQGMPLAMANVYRPFYLSVINNVVTEKDTAAAYKKAWLSYRNLQKNTDKQTMQTLGFGDDAQAEKILHDLINTLSVPWMKYFLLSEPAQYIEKINAKVLALNGEKDFQVRAKPNLTAIEAALKKSKSKVYNTKWLPGINHLFQKCNTCTISEYSSLEETFSPVALKEMGNWLQQNVQSK
jgi:pimeloyl-ACP methyl ester carboxylesterase